MKIIDRYIGKQVLFSTIFAVLVLSVVLVLGNILQKLMGQLVRSEIPLGAILVSIAYLLPFSLVFTIPWGFLTSILLVFGRLSADNELVSLRMAGLSVPRICLPVFALAVTLSGVCLWINVSVAPRAEAAIKRTLFEAAIENPLSLFVADQVTDRVPGHKIYVGEKRGNELYEFEMVQLDGRGAAKYVSADKVIVQMSEDGGEIELIMLGAHVEAPKAPGPDGESNLLDREIVGLGEAPQPISLGDLAKRARRGASQMLTPELMAKAADPEVEADDRSSYRVEYNKRISFSLACFTFTLIGIPLGITAQRRETSIGFALSLIVAAVYFMFIIVADWFKRMPEASPHLLIWLPNVLFIALGGYLFWRLSRR